MSYEVVSVGKTREEDISLIYICPIFLSRDLTKRNKISFGTASSRNKISSMPLKSH